MQKRNAVALLAVANLAAVPAVEAQVIFKCKDADGKVTYTEVPCLSSETGSVVDTRDNSADMSSIRSEVGRLKAPPPPVQSQSSSPEPPAPSPAPAPPPAQRSGY